MLRPSLSPSLSRLLLLLALGGLVGCGDDDSGDATDAGVDAGSMADAGVDMPPVEDMGAAGFDGEYFMQIRVNAPGGRVNYAIITEGLEVGEIDLGTGLEVSGFSRIRIFDEKIYAFDGESGLVTRYAVDAERGFSVDTLDDGEEARLSFSGLGIDIFANAIAFVSPERAFYFDTFALNQVVEFDPTEMTITGPLEGAIARDGFDQTNIGGRPTLIDDYVVFPISYADSFSAAAVETAALAVLDLSDSSFRVIEDPRCVATSSIYVDDGFVYAFADSLGAIGASSVGPGDLPPPCLLRWRPGSDAFDPDFFVDFDELAGQTLLAGGTSRGDGVLYSKTYVGEEPPSSLNVFELTAGPYWQLVRIDLGTGTTTVMEDFPPAGSGSGAIVVEGQYVFRETTRSDPNRLYALDGDGRRVELLSVAGDLFRVERFR